MENLDYSSLFMSDTSSVTVIPEDENSLQVNPFSQVVFTDLKKSYTLGSHILCKYKLKSGTLSQAGDGIGMYPVGWSSVAEFISFKHVSSEKDDDVIILSTKGLKLVEKSYYQLCYITRGNFIAGISLPFDFRKAKQILQTEHNLQTIKKQNARIELLEAQINEMKCQPRDVQTSADRIQLKKGNNSSSSDEKNVKKKSNDNELLFSQNNTIQSKPDYFRTNRRSIADISNETIESAVESDRMRDREEEEIKIGHFSGTNKVKTKNTGNKYKITSEPLKNVNEPELTVAEMKIKFEKLKLKYKNEVLKNNTLIKNCQKTEELIIENASLKKTLKLNKDMCEKYQSNQSLAEEQRDKIKMEYQLLHKTSIEKIASLNEELKSAKEKKILLSHITGQGCPECEKIQNQLKKCKDEKINLSSELIQAKHSNTVNLRLLKSANSKVSNQDQIISELKSQLKKSVNTMHFDSHNYSNESSSD